MKRQPHIVGARVILALAREECEPYTAQLAQHLGIRINTATKLLAELRAAGLVGRQMEAQARTPSRWRYYLATEGAHE